MPESIKNYVLVILIIAGCTFVIRIIVIIWRMFRLVDHSSKDASKSRQNENILWLQSDYEVQGRQEEGICSSVRLSDSNDHNRWFCHDMSIKVFYIVIWSFAALNCANMCLPMCGLLNMWAIEQSVK